MSFGRKGVAAGAVAPAVIAPRMLAGAPAAPAIARETAEEAELRRRREAFIAQDRARRANGDFATSHDDDADTGDYARPARPRGTQSLSTAYILWFFLGALSVHRFYLGAVESAVWQLGLGVIGLLCLFLAPSIGMGLMVLRGLWILADVFMIPGLHRKATGA